jgi:hypothetical protein
MAIAFPKPRVVCSTLLPTIGKHLRLQMLTMTTSSRSNSTSTRTEKELKASFEVIDEVELAKLAQVDVQTVRQWRTRHVGPKYFHAGNARLYFKQDVIDWFLSDRERHGSLESNTQVIA